MYNYKYLASELLRGVRLSRSISRGQMANKLGTSSAVIYNFETDRSRIPLTLFFRAIENRDQKASAVVLKHLFSIKDLPNLDSPSICKLFRNRLGISQKKLAQLLGYSSSSMIHHFEKGIREPSLADFLKMMELAGDNLRGLVMELTQNKSLANQFPKGRETLQAAWKEYWSEYYVSAIRQIIRTSSFNQNPVYSRGMFCKILGINQKQEDFAIQVLSNLKIIEIQQGKVFFNPEIRIAIPKDISKEKLFQIKRDWVRYSLDQISTKQNKHLLSTDLLPMNPKIFDSICSKIRDVQDEIHNIELDNTQGLMALSFLGIYIPNQT